MRGRFSIIVFVGAMLVLLVALNAASYVRVEREAELEIAPDRSTLNGNASGTRALYEFLEESGERVMRWRDAPAALARAPEKARPATFVVVGAVRVGFKEEEVKSLLEWVEAGGRLVVIDRAPHASLVESDEWSIVPNIVVPPQFDVRADDAESLTRDTPPLTPTQPTLLTRDIERIAPSRFASRLLAARKERQENANEASTDGTEAPVVVEDEPAASSNENAADEATAGGNTNADDEEWMNEDEQPPPPPKPLPSGATKGTTVSPGDPRPTATAGRIDYMRTEAAPSPLPATAPVYHVSDEGGALLVDFARGRGRIVVLSDPFIVANRGITRADNLQLAANIITQAGGLIAFDEYHQGRGATHNQLAAYFAGTPVLAMCAQLFLLAVAVVWTRGRRFARPLPAPRIDRRSKLEFVASMAELQQRARAYDLAIENVYGRTRRA
ncbi:MAG TPA: DUF4350 domain-containing protein, partial [Pyrinomonadaceae bacterium]|nr:DUF4350 domain-containing protein [Pyrinomonadaceae bacterium]